MGDSSDEESSESSGEFFSAAKIDLNSKFFTEQPVKLAQEPSNVVDNDDGDSTDSDDLYDVSEYNNLNLFPEILKNLESSKTLSCNGENVTAGQSASTATQGTVSSKEINELLLQGEQEVSSFNADISTTVEEKVENATESSEYTIPKGGVQITLPSDSVIFKKKRKANRNVEALIRKHIRTNQILIEKVGLLCWLAYGFYLNRQINDAEIMSMALSLMSERQYPKNRIDLTYLEQFTKWFKKVFTMETNEKVQSISKEILLQRLKDKKIFDYKELVLLYIAMLRAFGLNCRLVISLCPPHRKLHVTDTKKQKTKSETQPKVSKTNNKSKKKISTASTSPDNSVKTDIAKNAPNTRKNANLQARERAAAILKKSPDGKGKKAQKETSKKESIESDDLKKVKVEIKAEAAVEKRAVNESNKISSLRKLRSGKLINNNDVNDKTNKHNEADIKNEEPSSSNTRSKKAPVVQRKTRVTKTTSDNIKEEKKEDNKSVLHDEEAEDMDNQKETQNIWAEVYLESEESWICVSVMDTKVHCATEIYKKAKSPVLYIVAWNYDGFIKDVTRRYCPQWLTVTRKQRIEEKWWTETLSHWKEKESKISIAEDEMLLQKELEQPLPKTIGDCKGHPLYVLARHLLKYEALYPPNCVPLGHLHTGDAIYSRHCVHTLYSRETWLRKARVVKPNQEAYKIVKALPKYDKLSGMKLKDSALELFGHWQTMDYVPPEAKDGMVPRNEYGNVDLYKQCMLPIGTVHINLPGLNRIARKLNIDCAPAVVGFNFGCMGAVPAFEGFIVCSEYEDTLREAWEAEQLEAQKRAKEKREKRVYGNWKRLIHGLMIRERLVAKYEFSQEEKTAVPSKRSKAAKNQAKRSKVL
ncbi:hypothetical protein KM043_006851 [Ampulex compressa]|nr:hypothetical protein KM043_006851 [Ampulex compressa]